MKRICQLASLALFSVIFFSCQKEYSPEGLAINGNGNNGGSTGSGPLLVKISNTSTLGNSTTSYTYNKNNQLITILIAGGASGFTTSQKWQLVRNDKDKVIQYKTWNSNPVISDSAVYDVHYPPGSAYFDYTVASTSYFGITRKDSAFYTASSGKVTKVDAYQDLMGTGYMLSASTVYTYDGNGNIASENTYVSDLFSGNLTLATTKTYEYSNIPIVLHLGQEAFLFNSAYASNYNGIKEVYKDFDATGTNLGGNATISFAYKYNSLNKPVSCSITAVGTSVFAMASNGNATFSYQ